MTQVAAQPAEHPRLRQAGFEDFYRVHRHQVFRALALTLGDQELAAEAADEAMVRAYQHWRAVRHYANPPGWVYRVGLNWARSRLRKTRREVLAEPPEAIVDPGSGDPDLHRALRRLPLEARSLVVLRHFLDWSYAEIARAIQVPEGTVKSRLHRTIEELRGMVEVER